MTTKTDVWSDLELDCPALAADYRKKQATYLAKIQEELKRIFKRSMRPKSNMRVDQCTDRFRKIPSEASANPGDFQVSTYEVARGPMLAVTEKGVTVITVCAATQMMKTTFLESVALWVMLVNPVPMIMVEPDENAVTDLSKTKIDGMIKATPRTKKVLLGRQTVTRKSFMGGYIKLAWAGSEMMLAQNGVCITANDEIEKYPVLAGGDATGLTEKRSSTFGGRRKNLRVCSPRFENGPIWKSWLAGDMRRAFIRCPACDGDHVMRWKVDWKKPTELDCVIWDKDPTTKAWDLDSARYVCPNRDCRHEFTELQRTDAIQRVQWRQTKPFTCCEDDPDGGYQEPEYNGSWEHLVDPGDGQHIVSYATCRVCRKRKVPNRHASFHANGLYRPTPLADFVAEFEKTIGNVEKTQDFVNSDLAEPWEEELTIDVTAEGLAARHEKYPQEVPDRVAMLTCGVDTHDDRLEYEVVGWGRMGESWSIQYGVIVGKPSDPATWRKLDEVIFRDWQGAHGVLHVIQATCIDSGGHQTNHVYRYSFDRLKRRVWAVKGANEQGTTIAPIWPRSPSVQGNLQVPLYQVGTTLAKTVVMGNLSAEIPGPGFMHVPRGRDIEWYHGLLSEKQKTVNGVKRWRPKYDKVRNEALDCRVYAYAALEGLKGITDPPNPKLVEIWADRMGIGRDLTDEERSRWTIDEIQRVADETRTSIVQGRAKPVNRIADRSAKTGEPANEPDIGTVVASDSTDSLQSAQSGWQTASTRSLPAGRRAPFVVRRSGAPRG